MQEEFKLRTEDEINCDCCGSFVPTIECQWLSYHQRETVAFKYLCEFCYSSYGGSVFDYEPGSIKAEIWKATGAAVNFILRKKLYLKQE